MLIKCVAFVLSLLSGILGAAVTAKLWEWFVVPLGAPTIGVAHAYGLVLLFTMHAAVRQATALSDGEDKDRTYYWLVSAIIYSTAFLFGVVAKWFMG